MSIRASDVYTGFWTNWSKGNQIVGSTITLSSNAAAVLTAFLAMYVSLAASHLWSLIAYMIHQSRQQVTSGKCRPILQQQQVVLKAGLPPSSTVIRLTGLFWANRSVTSSLRNSWFLILISLLCAIGSIAAGLYSSQIIDSTAQLEVLLSSPNCGFFDDTTFETNQMQMAAVQNFLDTLTMSAAYSQRCYNSTDGQECAPFAVPAIDWTTRWDIPCPFDQSMCIGLAMELDTGLLNSNTILGLNSPPEGQIDLRKITTCAPITQDNYTVTVNASESGLSPHPLPGEEYVMTIYGPTDPSSTNDFTWGVSMYAANITLARTIEMEYYVSGSWANYSLFYPIPELNVSDGDGTLFFISSNALTFVEPCDDPVFSAHVPVTLPALDNDDTDNGTEVTYFLEDRLTGVLGCLEQYQWCDPSSLACSAIGPLSEATKDQVAQTIPLMSIQNATITMIVNILWQYASMSSITASSTGGSNIVANRDVHGTVQLPLPSNQWQIEVQAWHATVMTLLQQEILQWMIGPSNPILQQSVIHPTSPAEMTLCTRQRVRLGQAGGGSGGFANVSTFTLFLVVGLSTLIITTNLALDGLVSRGCCCFSSSRRATRTIGRPKQRAWIRDDVLHLQRLAYVGQSHDGKESGHVWVGADKDVPRVEGGTLLGPLVEPEAGGTTTTPERYADKTIARLSIDSLLRECV